MRLHADSIVMLNDQMKSKIPDIYYPLLCSRTDQEFDDTLEIILEKAMDYLEKNANFLFTLKEDAITAYLVGYLNMPGLHVTQQAHTNGHVDITIETDRESTLRRRLGEAKIYAGTKNHENGLKQLMDRYMTGRERSGLLVEYVKKADIKNFIGSLRIHMDTNKPCSQDGNAQNHWIQWSFVTQHRHSSGELIRVIHLSCNLYRPHIK